MVVNHLIAFLRTRIRGTVVSGVPSFSRFVQRPLINAVSLFTRTAANNWIWLFVSPSLKTLVLYKSLKQKMNTEIPTLEQLALHV